MPTEHPMPDDATPEAVDIDEARRIEAAMTPGPWRLADWSARFGTMEGSPNTIESGDDRIGPVIVDPQRNVVQVIRWQEDGVEREADLHGIVAMRNTYGPLLAEVTRLRAALRAALRAISDIRDSIVGAQGFNFSEHAYPLVAVLDGAGFKGVDYETARANLGTLIEQVKAAESALTTERRTVEELRVGLGEAAQVIEYNARAVYDNGAGRACHAARDILAAAERLRTLAGPR